MLFAVYDDKVQEVEIMTERLDELLATHYIDPFHLGVASPDSPQEDTYKLRSLLVQHVTACRANKYMGVSIEGWKVGPLRSVVTVVMGLLWLGAFVQGHDYCHRHATSSVAWTVGER